MWRGCWFFPRTTALIQVLWDQLVTSHTPQLGCKLFKGNRRPPGFIKKLDLELLVCSSLVAAPYLLKCCFPLAPQKGCKRLGSERMDTGCSHRLLGPERPDRVPAHRPLLPPGMCLSRQVRRDVPGWQGSRVAQDAALRLWGTRTSFISQEFRKCYILSF